MQVWGSFYMSSWFLQAKALQIYFHVFEELTLFTSICGFGMLVSRFWIGLFQKKYNPPPPPPRRMANIFDPPPDWILQTARIPLPPGFPSSRTPPPPLPARFPVFLKGNYWKQHAIEKTQHFIQKIPVYYNFKSSLNIAGWISTFFETDYSNHHRVFVQRTPLV